MGDDPLGRHSFRSLGRIDSTCKSRVATVERLHSASAEKPNDGYVPDGKSIQVAGRPGGALRWQDGRDRSGRYIRAHGLEGDRSTARQVQTESDLLQRLQEREGLEAQSRNFGNNEHSWTRR